jgi:hypothetical protein
MTLVFTICSINYLAQAKTLQETLLEHNPDFKFVVGLCDRLEGVSIDPAVHPTCELLEVHKIHIPDFEGMCKHYDITELNTAIKPYYIEYLLRAYQPDNIIYFDPDIIVYQPLTKLITYLQYHNLVVTPHLCSPLHDHFHPNEDTHLQTGIFNLGFIALKNSIVTHKFVRWWQEKLAKECVIDLENGLFVDQHWVDFAPVFFDKTYILKELGYNAAYWNLHERYFSKDEANTWTVNGTNLLYFFHFSGYGLNRPNDISKYQDRFTFEQRPDVLPLFKDYAQRLEKNGNAYFIKFPCVYVKPKKVKRYLRVRKVLKMPLQWLLAP